MVPTSVYIAFFCLLNNEQKSHSGLGSCWIIINNRRKRRKLVSGNQDIQIHTTSEVQFRVGSLAATLKQAVQVETGDQTKGRIQNRAIWPPTEHVEPPLFSNYKWMAFLKWSGSINLNVKEIRNCPQISLKNKLRIGAVYHGGICNCQCP